MTVQERRSVAQRIAELRRLHTVSIFHGLRSDETAELAIATRNLLPVLLASWELVDAQTDISRERSAAAWKSYKEALKGIKDE